MDRTPISLLDRLRVARPDDSVWLRLEEIYQPLIRRWLNRVPALREEAADLTQDVFLVIVRKIPAFEPQREGSFRAWNRQITVNMVRNHQRRSNRVSVVGFDPSDAFLDNLADANSEVAREWDLDHDRHVFQKLQAIVQPEFEPATWQAFRRFALDGLPPAQVAAELGLSVNAVTLAKSRILKRLRQEAGDLLK